MAESKPTRESIFDPVELHDRCLQSADLTRRVLQAFLNHGEQEMVALATSIHGGEIQETARLAHRVKGASDNVAAHRLRQMAAELEHLARNGSTDLEGTYQKMCQEWEHFKTSAEAYLLPIPKNSVVPVAS